jgi:hypothetical protein
MTMFRLFEKWQEPFTAPSLIAYDLRPEVIIDFGALV